MLYEFAPMEGLTTWYFRQLHHTFFGGAARYYTPFLSANQNLSFQSREKAEIAPEHNQGITLVPQIMTNRADEFVWAIRYLEER
ncbi:MAG: diguanylate cyclase, partial [Lachnospiraceae bacterium]|nr:diguanylate cyclase [Lachnospiraceae bacterium]